MENGYSGSINPSDVATLSLLGRGGIGGGYSYGKQFADDASNAVRIKSSEKLSSQGHDFLSQQISDNADRNRDINALQIRNAADISNRDFQTTIGFNLSGQIARGEDNQNGNFNSLTRELAAISREAAKCCCEQKLLALENQAKTDAKLATVIANQECDSKVAAAVANATQNAKLDILLAEGGGHHRGN